MGSGIFAEIWPGPDPARPPPLSAAEHAPTPTHPHTPAHVDAIDFNTPRLISFGKKKRKPNVFIAALKKNSPEGDFFFKEKKRL